VIIVEIRGVIMGPGFPDQGSGGTQKKVLANGMPYYTLGTTGLCVTDVVAIS
jgi:hypothetical protein